MKPLAKMESLCLNIEYKRAPDFVIRLVVLLLLGREVNGLEAVIGCKEAFLSTLKYMTYD